MFSIKKGNTAEIQSFLSGRSLFNSPDIIEFYPRSAVLTVRRRTRLAAVWMVPTIVSEDKFELARPFRLLPYTHLHVADGSHPSRRRGIIQALAEWIASTDSGISKVNLPFSTHGVGCGPFTQRGFRVEQRHTYLLDLSADWTRLLSATCANNVRHARARVYITRQRAIGSFDCSRGVTFESSDAFARRSLLIDHLIRTGRGMTMTATDRTGTLLGQCFVSWDAKTGYLLHNWRSEDAPRGTVNLLIFNCVEYVQQVLGLSQFDFEGSVIPSVDCFYATFGGEPLPYPHLHWSRSNGRQGLG
jgi:hypothetical protein